MSGPDKKTEEGTEEEHEEEDIHAKAPKDPAPPPLPFLPRAENATSAELVLKVRKQSPRENDFIEIELDRQKLTYQDLLQVSCRELGINLEQVVKIRKLPNTLLRKKWETMSVECCIYCQTQLTDELAIFATSCGAIRLHLKKKSSFPRKKHGFATACTHKVYENYRCKETNRTCTDENDIKIVLKQWWRCFNKILENYKKRNNQN